MAGIAKNKKLNFVKGGSGGSFTSSCEELRSGRFRPMRARAQAYVMGGEGIKE